MEVAIITHIPSPYQVELFDVLNKRGVVHPFVIYLEKTSLDRLWAEPTIRHDNIYLEQALLAQVDRWLGKTDLVVISGYQHSVVRSWMQRRETDNRPWAFWGERPGVNFPLWIGRPYRKVALSALHGSLAPIWGIGSEAVRAYQREFGRRRQYFSVPYFSDLTRFISSKRTPVGENASLRFLYSGALTRRKGVDVLATAFARLARERSDICLHWVGEGELRAGLEQQLLEFGDRVMFHGFQQWKELPAFYHSADIICVPSRHDGWGLVVPEGLAAGLPVISTKNVGAAIDLVTSGRNGWLIPKLTVGDLYHALSSAAALPRHELQLLSEQAVASVSTHSLEEGAMLFERAALDTVSGWSRPDTRY